MCRRLKKCKDWKYKLVMLLGIANIIALTGACGAMFYTQIILKALPESEKPTKHVIVKYVAVSSQDSLAKNRPYNNARTDSVLTIQEARISNLEVENARLQMNLERALDDCRQETNNNINKSNGWLGFWIATMTILGVILPILMQHKNSKEERERIDKALGHAEKRIADEICKIKSEYQKIENRTKALLKTAEEYRILSDLQNSISSFIECIEAKLIIDGNWESAVEERLRHSLITRFNQLISISFLCKENAEYHHLELNGSDSCSNGITIPLNCCVDPERRPDLIQSLVHIYKFIDICLTRESNHNCARRLQQLEDKVHVAINACAEESKTPAQLLKMLLEIEAEMRQAFSSTPRQDHSPLIEPAKPEDFPPPPPPSSPGTLDNPTTHEGESTSDTHGSQDNTSAIENEVDSSLSEGHNNSSTDKKSEPESGNS